MTMKWEVVHVGWEVGGKEKHFDQHPEEINIFSWLKRFSYSRPFSMQGLCFFLMSFYKHLIISLQSFFSLGSKFVLFFDQTKTNVKHKVSKH